MNWPLTIAEAKDVLVGLAAAATTWAAVYGLTKWRVELSGRTNFQVARALARATYKLRDELAMSRAVIIRGQEFPSSYSTLGQHTAQEEADAWAHVYTNRWTPVLVAVQEFEAQGLEAEALWGKSARQKVQALRACVSELGSAIEAVLVDKANSGQDFATNREFGKRMRAVVSATGSETTNDLSKRIASAVEGIEEMVKKHLQKG